MSPLRDPHLGALLRELPEPLLSALLETGASAAQLREAVLWLEQAEVLVRERPVPEDVLVLRAYAILRVGRLEGTARSGGCGMRWPGRS